MQLVNNRPTRAPQRAIPQQPRKRAYVEDYQPIDLQYDDDVPTFGEYDEPEKVTLSKPQTKSQNGVLGEILARLENIENKLTKLEGMIQTAVVGGQQPISTSAPAQAPAPMMIESVVPRQGSMLGEIQSVIAQQGGVQPEMTFNRSQQSGGISQVPQMAQPDMVTSVGTLAPNVYDDDIGDIEAFG